ncbi:hypothetical protein HY382_02090 [Candidatus Curtissbacteria bacterium]|nr:hypothetical protein [Candidatus Curtissbacteria bacterium]
MFYKSGKLDSFLGKQDKPAATAATQSQDALSKSDEVEDIERDLSTTNLSETDNVLGEVDIQLNAR